MMRWTQPPAAPAETAAAETAAPPAPTRPGFTADLQPDLRPYGLETGELVGWEPCDTPVGPGVRWWFEFRNARFTPGRLPFVTGLAWRPGNHLWLLAQALDVPAPEQTFADPDFDPDELIGCACLVDVQQVRTQPFGESEARLTPQRPVNGRSLRFRRQQNTPPVEPELPRSYLKLLGRV
jgi:hypothetical protein